MRLLLVFMYSHFERYRNNNTLNECFVHVERDFVHVERVFRSCGFLCLIFRTCANQLPHRQRYRSVNAVRISTNTIVLFMAWLLLFAHMLRQPTKYCTNHKRNQQIQDRRRYQDGIKSSQASLQRIKMPRWDQDNG